MWVTAVHEWGSGRQGGRSLLTDQILRAFHARAIVLTDRDTNLGKSWFSRTEQRLNGPCSPKITLLLRL